MQGTKEWGDARIPVFASVPSKLNQEQRASRDHIYGALWEQGLEPRTVGSLEPGIYNPLHEVRTLARHCAGGVILGYGQVAAEVAKGYATSKSAEGHLIVVETTIERYLAPTPWNQLETGVLFGLSLPLFVLKQERISGGIFDEGASDVLVHTMPMPGHAWSSDSQGLQNPDAEQSFKRALMRWQALVRAHYYGDERER